MRTLDDITQGEDLDLIMLKGSLDFEFFCNRILQNPQNHKEGLELAWFHKEWLNMVRNNKRVCIQAARQHGKTELLAVSYPLWLSFYFKHKNILIVSNALKQSKKVLGRVKTAILDNELLRRLIPQDRRMSWSKTEIETTTGCKIECRAFNENIKGDSYHYILADEVAEYEDHDIFYYVIVPTTAFTRGTICCITTPKSKVDLSAELFRNQEYVCGKYAAIKEDGIPLWPEKYSIEYLMEKKKEIGPLAFEREFMCNPVSSEAQVIPYEKIIAAYDTKETIHEYGETGHEYYMGCDIAVSKVGDYSVFTIIEMIDDKFYIRHIDRPKRGMGINSQQMRIEDLYERFLPKKVMIDESNVGQAFVQDLRMKGLPVTSTDFSPKNRNSLFLNLVKLFDEERIIIPRNTKTPITKRITDELTKELANMITGETKSGQFTYKSAGAHDDMFVSLCLAMRVASNRRPFKVMIGMGKRERQITGEKMEDNRQQKKENTSSPFGGAFKSE